MRWFEGSIAEAVASSKQRNAVFVVFAEGTDDASTRTATAIEDPNVLAKLESNNFVAIKLGSGTEEYNQFTQIYRIVPVPSIFFIGSNGRPIEIVAGASSPETILSKIEIVLAGIKPNIKSPEGGASASTPSPPQTSSPAAVSSAAIKPEVSVASPQTPSAGASENAVEKAKELMEKARLLKMEQEKVKEREKEEERRRVGKEVQELRRWQQDQEMKQLKEEREREKKEEHAARERVREQIAMDKAERAKRNLQEAPVKKEEPTTGSTTLPTSTSNSTVARLQLRLPDGSNMTTQLAADAPLSDLRRLVSERLAQSARAFTMATTFPRRELTAQLDTHTMTQLGLTPTAVVLVLPSTVGSSVVRSSSSAVSSVSWLFWSVMAPVISLLNYVRGIVFGGGPTTSTSANQDAAARRRTEPPTEPQGRPSRNPPPTATMRRQGNVHRLAQAQDSSDEENNTWNGNSTQQM